jgi:hypothetical protein
MAPLLITSLVRVNTAGESLRYMSVSDLEQIVCRHCAKQSSSLLPDGIGERDAGQASR